MPKTPKAKVQEYFSEPQASTQKVEVVNGISPLHLGYNFGREDLDSAFKKVEEKINEIIKKIC